MANSISGGSTATGFSWTVAPWPLDDTVALRCVERPALFDWNTPNIPTTCEPLKTDNGPGGLVAEFDARSAPAGVIALLDAVDPPWFLVVAGHKGLTNVSVATEVVDSPIPSDAGPS